MEGKMKELLISFCVIALLAGCVSLGQMSEATVSGAQLTKNNYKVVKVGVVGESKGFKLFCIIPFASPTFADAKTDLYKNTNLNLEGRSFVLANQTTDYETRCFLLFSLTKVTLNADIIEFKDESIVNKEQAP